MEEEKIKRIYEILDNIPVTSKNEKVIQEIRQELLNQDYMKAFNNLNNASSANGIIERNL